MVVVIFVLFTQGNQTPLVEFNDCATMAQSKKVSMLLVVGFDVE